MKLNKNIFSMVGFAFFLFYFIPTCVVALVSPLINSWFPSITSASWYMWALNYIPMYCIAFPIMVWFMKKIPDSPFPHVENKLSGEVLTSLMVVSLSVTFLCAYLTNGITYLLSLLTHSTITNPLETALSGSNIVLNFLIVGIFAPIIEEYIFRGLTYKKLGAYGSKTYVLTSALIFALFHSNIYQFLYTFLLGIIFAFVTYKTGTIKYSTILHLTVNLFASGGLGLIVTYLNFIPLSALYAYLIIAVTIGGVIIGIIGAQRYKSQLHFEAGPLPSPKMRQLFFNPGMWLFILLTLVSTVSNLFA